MQNVTPSNTVKVPHKREEKHQNYV